MYLKTELLSLTDLKKKSFKFSITCNYVFLLLHKSLLIFQNYIMKVILQCRKIKSTYFEQILKGEYRALATITNHKQ